nr:hypothetical protein [Planctomycetota bacterium]
MSQRIGVSFLAVIIAIVSACGSGGGGSGGSSTASAPTELSRTNPPWQIAPANDLALYAIHSHQDYHADPRHISFWWSVRST